MFRVSWRKSLKGGATPEGSSSSYLITLLLLFDLIACVLTVSGPRIDVLPPAVRDHDVWTEAGSACHTEEVLLQSGTFLWHHRQNIVGPSTFGCCCCCMRQGAARCDAVGIYCTVHFTERMGQKQRGLAVLLLVYVASSSLAVLSGERRRRTGGQTNCVWAWERERRCVCVCVRALVWGSAFYLCWTICVCVHNWPLSLIAAQSKQRDVCSSSRFELLRPKTPERCFWKWHRHMLCFTWCGTWTAKGLSKETCLYLGAWLARAQLSIRGSQDVSCKVRVRVGGWGGGGEGCAF